MKAQSKIALLLILLFYCDVSFSTVAGVKRTLYTSGEVVFPIHYQLGQSTVLFLGVKPEVVICGNKNYFNIEKLKEGITIQPLATIATNLSILSGERRYLFYLSPTSALNRPDGFVEVKWIPPGATRAVISPVSQTQMVLPLNQVVSLDSETRLTVQRLITLSGSDKSIIELTIEPQKKPLNSQEITITAFKGKVALKKQVLVWGTETLVAHKVTAGRLILNETFSSKPSIELAISFNGHTTRVKIQK